MTGNHKCILSEKKDRVAVLTVQSPQQLNTFNFEMAREFHEALETLEEDDEVGVLVLTGSGKAFCAWQELQLLKGEAGELRKGLKNLKNPRLLHFEKPVIAAVNEAAIGAAADFMLMSDMVIASEAAKVSFPGGRAGFSAPLCRHSTER